MSTQHLRLVEPRPAPPRHRRAAPLGQYLVESGAVSPARLARALRQQLLQDAPLGEILVSRGWASAEQIQEALAHQHDIHRADLTAQPPDAALCAAMPARFWLAHGALPWMRMGQTVLVATSRPDRFGATRAALRDTFPDVMPVLASEHQVSTAIAHGFAQPLAEAAGCRVAARFSCRTWRSGNRVVLPALLLAFAIALLAFPAWVLAALAAIAVGTLFLFAVFKLIAALAHLHHRFATPKPATPPLPGPPRRLPRVSVLVPLFREQEIADALIRRLHRLTYPRALLDVVLVLEEHDDVTRKALGRTTLPDWMRIIEVPAHGGLTTKPRAMNYALDFCRGDIIGIWDAEDAPAPDQIERVAARFAAAPDDVVCLQGILDYYNPRTNWLSRCFTIEYASWFRVVMPGIARLGLVVPLGGTTLFFRRDKLEELGGWDAHNVTEDADLGVRLCRAGYRTEPIDTATFEEASCRPWPWVKQRSRWLKGFMVTYLVHMRSPRQLWRDLGMRRFLGFQAFFVGTLCQFLLAPVLWSFWLILLGQGHPLQGLVPQVALQLLAGLFIAVELTCMGIGFVAVSTGHLRHLAPWVPTLILYFPMGALAAYKALYELVLRPYYWDKTKHGEAGPEMPPA